MSEEDGVWRTICGRKVFINKGQSLTDAMRESGKFSKTDIKESPKKPVSKENGRDAKTMAERVYEPTITERVKKRKNKVVDYVERFRNGEDVENEIEVANVGKREREEIEKLTGEKVNATSHVLHVDELRHMENRHGQNGGHDHSMANVSNYKHIVDVLQNFDNVDYCRDKSGNKVYSTKYRDNNNNPHSDADIYKKV